MRSFRPPRIALATVPLPMSKDLVAEASTRIAASPETIWHALTDRDTIRKYMFGSNVESDWKEGSAITWQGEWEGRAYEDKGVVQKVQPERMLQYTHFSPLTGLPDKPENYHTVTIELAEDGSETGVTLRQDGNATEEARDHSQKNWSMMLEGLKKVVEES
jgi:uncharacterized protein YndB with AHSA1/START domain